ncbi:MAG: hypothetical protein HY961_05205 [Ignavibacteriae bacterium]|nr:hypothetical protein [Ignavibacteriota bacterium]
MEDTTHRHRIRRNRLQLLDNTAPQFESFMESREQYIRVLEETIDLVKRDHVKASANNVAIRDTINQLMAMQQLSNSISTANEPEAIVATLVHLTRQVLQVVESNVFLFDDGTNRIVPLSSKTSKPFVAEAAKQV